jgi:HD superfamily phosphohydrolase
MAVDSVNNNNAGLYAVGGAVLGAGAGAGTAYLTRPFLKNGEPTDEFIKETETNLINKLPSDEKGAAIKEKKEFDRYYKSVNKAGSVDELETIVKEHFIKIQQENAPLIEVEGESRIIQSKESQEAAADIMWKRYEGKSLDEIKRAINLEAQDSKNVVKNSAIEAFDICWDSTKKQFISQADPELNKISKSFKEAAKNIQGKYALIYGAIGAGVLGLVGYICGSSDKT